MSEPKIVLVEPKRFTINVPFMASPMTIGTESDEIVILMSFTLRPRDNVMDITFNVSTSGDATPVPSLDKNSPSDVGGYYGAPFRR